MNFQDFLNKYGDKGEITSQSINQASAAGVSTKDLNKFVDKAGDKVGSNVFGGKSGNILSGGGNGSSSGSSGGYSGLDMDLGAYEAMAAIDTANQDFLNQGQYNSSQIIAGINADANKYVADAYAGAQMYGADAQVEIAGITSSAEERWRKYLADQERATAENVATIQGEYGLDLQEIITAGLKDVETIRGEYGIQAETLRGEYGLETERIKGATDRDVAQRQKEAAIYGNMMQGFWS